jgi:hypothetical protein
MITLIHDYIFASTLAMNILKEHLCYEGVSPPM